MIFKKAKNMWLHTQKYEDISLRPTLSESSYRNLPLFPILRASRGTLENPLQTSHLE